jgi:NNP family nitrate/nitrite transporter-like MFS transporter
LVMGATYDEANQSYTVGLVLLSVTAIVALVFVIVRLWRKEGASESPTTSVAAEAQ